MTNVRILLIDDHVAVRLGVRSLLESQPGWKVCGEAATGKDGIEAAKELRPDIVVQDFTLPELDGLEVLRQIKKSVPAAEVIIFTGRNTEEIVYQAFDGGARSCILKTDEAEHLTAAVQAAAQHKPYFTPWVSTLVLNRLQQPKSGEDRPAAGSVLTPRERETVQIVAEGKSNKELAERLGVSLRTAESHRASIMRKLDLHTVGEVVRYAVRNGIIEA
jgi:two-component system, NarL family, response regulator NreC